MLPIQVASLVNAALQSAHPLTLLDTAVVAFRMIGRQADVIAADWIGYLYADGEMESLTGLRAIPFKVPALPLA